MDDGRDEVEKSSESVVEDMKRFGKPTVSAKFVDAAEYGFYRLRSMDSGIKKDVIETAKYDYKSG